MTTLNTRGASSPEPISDLDEFLRRALGFDHYYAFSDDHRCYLAGRRAEDRILEYASQHKIAQKIWDHIRDAHSEKFFAGQLMTRVERVIFADDDEELKAAVNSLEDFCIPYLASTGRDSMIGKSIRNAIARMMGAPPSWKDKDERERMIEEYIANYERKAK